jgi:hypothetical protein
MSRRSAYTQELSLCNQAEETVSHFLICCKTLEYLRAPTVNNIIEESIVNCLLYTVLKPTARYYTIDYYRVKPAIVYSVSNEILPIKAHLLDWSNKTQCHYIPIVNTIQHQCIYTSHVI